MPAGGALGGAQHFAVGTVKMRDLLSFQEYWRKHSTYAHQTMPGLPGWMGGCMSKRIIKSSIHFEAPAYWATIAYARSWLATDGVRLAHIQKRAMAGSNLPYLTPRDVRSIAVEYNFNRGIRHGNTSAEGLANLVNEIRQTWPDNLLERADKCEYVINNASKNEFTRGSQSSAVTKLMWFLAPRGWTLYDRFARKGLASKQVFDEIESCSIPNEDSIKLMKYFYRKLEKRLIPLAQA